MASNRFSKSVKLIAAFSLLAPLSVWGQGDGAVKKILDKAKETKTEAAKHAATVDAVQQPPSKPMPSTPAQTPPPSAPMKSSSKKGEPMKPVEQPMKPAAKKPMVPQNDKGDPFALPPKPRNPAALPQVLPPGQAGLLVSQAEVQGMVHMASGNRVIIRGPGSRVYFMKPGDKIYNARITRITDDAVYFDETVIDINGKTEHREVAKRMPSEGKQ